MNTLEHTQQLFEVVQNLVSPLRGGSSGDKKRKSETGSKDVYHDILAERCEPPWSTDRCLTVNPNGVLFFSPCHVNSIVVLTPDEELYYVYKGKPLKIGALARDDGLTWKARFRLAGKGLVGISYNCRSALHTHLKKHVWISMFIIPFIPHGFSETGESNH